MFDIRDNVVVFEGRNIKYALKLLIDLSIDVVTNFSKTGEHYVILLKMYSITEDFFSFFLFCLFSSPSFAE